MMEALGRMDLDVWQNDALRESLTDLETKFSVARDQKGFLARPTRQTETLTIPKDPVRQNLA